MRRLIYKSAMVALTASLSTDVSLRVLGWINRFVLSGRLNTATLFYFADARYLESETFAWYARRRKWAPCFAGVFFQSQTGGAICVIGCSEAEFLDPSNRDRVLQMQQRMQSMGRLLGAATVSYSGILPSVLARAGVQREPIEIDRTVHWIVKALGLLRQQCGLSGNTPIVVVGAAGFVGVRIVALLRGAGDAPVVEIDPAHSDPACRDLQDLETLRGRQIIVLNVSRNQVIEHYAPKLWRGVTVLNEVYPECGSETLAALKRTGVRYFHLQGVRAVSLPRFPGAYKGAVPCCAASAAMASSSAPDSNSTEILLREQ